LAWDEDTIDDPAAKPYRPKQKAPAVVDEAAVIRALSGERIGLSPAERTAAVERGVRQGLDYETVADILGSSVETVQRTWERRKAAGRARGEAWAGQAQMTKAA
jgi:DNA-directed RNA polymerase specialized sigma24 family protein